MQLVEGRTLSGEVRERGPLRERETARIAIPLLEALEYSHARGIVHRDIKPENIILDREGRPFLMDFGIAKSAGSLVKTQTGFLLGTPAYVAPEQAQGKKLDGRADLYALGVTLYKTVSGAYPFEASDPLQAVILRLTQPPRPLAEARPGSRPGFRRRSSCGPSSASRRDAGLPRARCGMRSTPTSQGARRIRRRRASSDPGDSGRRGAGASSLITRSDSSSAPSRLRFPFREGTQPARPAATSALGAPSRRSHVVPLAAVFVILLFAVGGTGLVFFRTGRKHAEEPSAPSGRRPSRRARSRHPSRPPSRRCRPR